MISSDFLGINLAESVVEVVEVVVDVLLVDDFLVDLLVDLVDELEVVVVEVDVVFSFNSFKKLSMLNSKILS